MQKKDALRIAGIEQELERIRSEFMICESCTKNCCSFHDLFILRLSESSAQSAYGERTIKQLMREKRMRKTVDGYELMQGPCPMLDGNRCSIHHLKDEYGLERCMKFPLFPTSYSYDGIIADLRCFEFKMRQTGLLEELARIEDSFGVSVYIKYAAGHEVRKERLEEYVKSRSRKD